MSGMVTGCHQRSTMAAVLTVFLLCGSLRPGCTQLDKQTPSPDLDEYTAAAMAQPEICLEHSDESGRPKQEECISTNDINLYRDGLTAFSRENDTTQYYIFDREFLLVCAKIQLRSGLKNYIEKRGLDVTHISNNPFVEDMASAIIIFDYRSDNSTVTEENTEKRHRCVTDMADDGLMVLKLTLPAETHSNTADMEFAVIGQSGRWFATIDSLEASYIFILENKTSVAVTWKGSPNAFRVELQFQLLPWDGVNMTVTNTAFLKGIGRHPFWDGISVYGAGNLEIYTILDVAPEYNHYSGTVVSWEHFGVDVYEEQCTTEFLKLTTGDLTYELCGHFTPPPRLFTLPNVRIDYYSGIPEMAKQGKRTTGYSFRFSFHNDSALPQQLPDKKWDCSVPYWGDFKEHLLCNLLAECVGGEDEAACPYSEGTCPHGYWSAGGSCFSLEPIPRYQMSWNEADKECRSRGDRLPTLNTEDKWRAVVELLGFRRWHYIYVGLTSGHSLPNQYKDFLQWTDQSVAYYLKAELLLLCEHCAFLRVDRVVGTLYLDLCNKQVPGNLMCEKYKSNSPSGNVRVAESKTLSRINSTKCRKGHVTHNFLAYDPWSHCFDEYDTSLSQPLTSLPPTFQCYNKFERVPFTLVCDHREDCSDGSDEICVLKDCQGFKCHNFQCIPTNMTCDGVHDCIDSSDEFTCNQISGRSTFIDMSKSLPAMVLHDGRGFYDLEDIFVENTSQSQPAESLLGCPKSHFRCPGIKYYCLPVYVRCNNVYDCPGRQDEVDCHNFQRCPGFYRCRDSFICVHGDHLCDGIFQCPQRDDELMCGFVCPAGCTCYGLAFFCTQPFVASKHAGLRFLDARGSGMDLKALVNNTLLFHLNLAKCDITHLETAQFVNIRHLDLSKNSISTLAENHVSSCKHLQNLILAGNPIRNILEGSLPNSSTSFAMLELLDLSSVPIKSAIFETFRIFRNVSKLDLSNTGLDSVSTFSVFSRLRVLDLRGCPVTHFTPSVFKGFDDRSTVYSDNYKLCCPSTLPEGFNVLNCHAPFDEISSCEGLLKSGIYRVGLAVLTIMIITGNAGSFVYRVFFNPSKKQTSFGFFVTNLCVSDFLMGVYSAAVGVADRVYLGNYVLYDVAWSRSVTCKIAGFLSLVSNEVSVFIICLITVDRFLVTRFPFSQQLHFSLRSARVACVTAWSVGILVAVTPLLPVTSHWMFYSQTGMCIPLPVTRKMFDGREFSVGVFVFLNFVLFLVIATGQVSIYLSVSANSMATGDSTQKAVDITIARRLITVAVSDFLCWFPVGLLGIMTSAGHPIPGEASVVIAVFVLPLNSALNPFLYTVNIILEKRQKAREQHLLKMLLARARAGPQL